jgi:hypothetical protein
VLAADLGEVEAGDVDMAHVAREAFGYMKK